MGEPKYRDEEWLREQYLEKGRVVRKIADDCDVDRSTIYNWLNEFGIERQRGPGYRSDEPDKYRDAEWLKEKYHDEKLSTAEIASLCDCSKETIRRWMDRHGIEARSYAEANPLSWEGDEERREFFRELHSEPDTDPEFYHTYEWRETRKRVIERDDGICQDCGKETESPHAHHLDPVSDGGAKYDPENLITLCSECHAERHPNRAILTAI